MGYINTIFLGKEYSIPQDVLFYIELLEFTDNVQKQLASTFVRKLRNELDQGNVGCLDNEIMAPDIEQQVGKFIAKLTDHGIYDRTINDYLRKNEGYKLISKVNTAALDEAKRALRQQIDDWLEGYEDALHKKDASVTGLGFSIWSSSFVNHAIYAAMEVSKVKEQERAAVKEYQKDMAELDARLESRKSQEEKQYITNVYIPHMETAITVFSYELLDTFISDLIQYGKLSKDVLNYIHIDRSNDLLKNLELSQNKEAVLLKAFEACPYNVAVYMQAMKYDLLDYESFQTAKTIADYIRLFEINDVAEEDTPEIVAEKLLKRGAEFPGTNFYVCGYSRDEPYVFFVTSTTKERSNVDSNGNVKFSLSWGGETEALVKLINAAPVMNSNEKLMPLKDGIDLAEFMVDVTIKYQRFSDCIKTCGGPIDVLVMTKDSAFWHKNKLHKT